jgi:hypothetical protein
VFIYVVFCNTCGLQYSFNTLCYASIAYCLSALYAISDLTNLRAVLCDVCCKQVCSSAVNHTVFVTLLIILLSFVLVWLLRKLDSVVYKVIVLCYKSRFMYNTSIFETSVDKYLQASNVFTTHVIIHVLLIQTFRQYNIVLVVCCGTYQNFTCNYARECHKYKIMT